MIALQDLGEALVALSVDTLKKLDLPDDLRTAVMDAKRIPTSKFGGFKRQMQYIGKIMRHVDAVPIRAQLDAFSAPNKQQTAQHHLAERWRERLLTDETALGAFRNQFEAADADMLVRLIAAAKDERAKSKPPKHFRLLYKTIHDLLADQMEQEATE